MAYKVIADKCTSCGACISACPSEVISSADDGKSIIDADSCVDCASCTDVCPSEAIIQA